MWNRNAIFINMHSFYPIWGCIRCQNLVGFAPWVMELWGFQVQGIWLPQIFSAP